MSVNVRLQGGPFEGERQRNILQDELTPVIWVERCRQCGSHWYSEEAPTREPYREDVECGIWLIYVWVDCQLSDVPPEEELAHA